MHANKDTEYYQNAAADLAWRHFGLSTPIIVTQYIGKVSYPVRGQPPGTVDAAGRYHWKRDEIEVCLPEGHDWRSRDSQFLQIVAHEAWHALQNWHHRHLFHPSENLLVHQYREWQQATALEPDAVARAVTRREGWPLSDVMLLPPDEREAFALDHIFVSQHEPGPRDRRRRIFGSIFQRGYDEWKGRRPVRRPRSMLHLLYLVAGGILGGRALAVRERQLHEDLARRGILPEYWQIITESALDNPRALASLSPILFD